MRLQLKEQRVETNNIRTFIFGAKEPTSWQAGQYIHYTLHHNNPDERGDERWFTISSPPYQKDIQITTRINNEHSSSFKAALVNLKPGDEIQAEAPEGDFVVNDSDKSYIFVAGGIGITPFYSILKQLSHEGKNINVELLYGIRDENDIPFRDELEELSKKHRNFNITYFVGDKKIDEKTLREYGSKLGGPIYYVSGPEPMVEAFKAVLVHMGIDKDHSKFDYFPGYKAV